MSTDRIRCAETDEVTGRIYDTTPSGIDIDALRTALVDENGLLPTNAATEVLLTAIGAMDDTDRNWNHAGAPSVRDYARRIVGQLELAYGDHGRL